MKVKLSTFVLPIAQFAGKLVSPSDNDVYSHVGNVWEEISNQDCKCVTGYV